MRHILLSLLLIVTCSFLGTAQRKKTKSAKASSADMSTYMDQITLEELRADLHFIASDYFEGRGTGSKGNDQAAQFLASSYIVQGIPPVRDSKSGSPFTAYLQSFPFESGGKSGFSQNVAAFIEGSDPKLKDEVIVLSAHYDHLGINPQLEGDQIFNGAADDGSGTVALLEIAESFRSAKLNGNGPKRSILFLHFSGEEIGLQGSIYYTTQEPLISLEKVVAVINLDGVGGWDIKNVTGSEDYVYVLQNDSTSAFLADQLKTLNTLPGLSLRLLTPRNPGSFQSDNKSFEYMLIPSIYFSTGLTEHYHKVTDEPGTINYEHMTKIVKLVFALSWDLGNTSESINTNFHRSDYATTGHYFCPPCGCAYDQSQFDEPGLCPSCKMGLEPIWKKKSLN